MKENKYEFMENMFLCLSKVGFVYSKKIKLYLCFSQAIVLSTKLKLQNEVNMEEVR